MRCLFSRHFVFSLLLPLLVFWMRKRPEKIELRNSDIS